MKTDTTNFRITSRSCRLAVGARPSTSVAPSIGARGGFTFIEVLFSIVILGVGMIMIAGMLPVAIKQTADARNDLTAKVVCDSGYAFIRTLIATHPEAFPETCGVLTIHPSPPISPQPVFKAKPGSALESFLTDKDFMLLNGDAYTAKGGVQLPDGPNATNLRAGRVMPLSYDVVLPSKPTDPPTSTYDLGTLIKNEPAAGQPPPPIGHYLSEYPLAWNQTNLGDRVNSGEPRFQWLAFYRRDEAAAAIKLIIVAMRMQSNEATDHYDASITMPQEAINARNGPFLVPVEIEDSITEADKVKFVGTPGTNAYDIDVAETGSYLIIAHSPPLSGNVSTGDLNRPYRNNGRVFKLGARREDLDAAAGGARVWDLAPGYDLPAADPGPDGIVGTADDLPDGSMNTAASFDSTRAVTKYPISQKRSEDVAGTTTWAWIVGRGRTNPTDPSNTVPYNGPTQDLGVTTIDVPLK